MTTIQHLQQDIVSWANDVFPNRTPQQAFLKLHEELGEVIRDPRSHHEWADVLIMVFDLAHHYDISGDDLTEAVREKMEINRRRSWIKNEMGVMQHENVPLDDTIALEVRLVDGPCIGVETINMRVSYNVVPVPPDEILITNDHGMKFIYNLKYDTCRDGHYEYEIVRVIE